MNSFIPIHSYTEKMGMLRSGFLDHSSLHTHMSLLALIQHSHISPHAEEVPVTACVLELAFFLYLLAQIMNSSFEPKASISLMKAHEARLSCCVFCSLSTM